MLGKICGTQRAYIGQPDMFHLKGYHQRRDLMMQARPFKYYASDNKPDDLNIGHHRQLEV